MTRDPAPLYQKVSLGDVARVISGFAFKSSSFQDHGVPVIKIKNIRVGSVDLSDVDHVESSFLSLDEKYHVRHEDLLISLTGSHLTQPNSVVGRVAIWREEQGHCLLNQRAGKIDVTRPDICDRMYLFYSLSTTEVRRKIALMASGAASQANVSPSQVESVEILLPPLHIQREIASVLSAYDDLITNNTRRIEILEEMARSIYREWFIHLRFPGYQKAKKVGTPNGLIPEGWEHRSIITVPPFRFIRENVRSYEGQKKYLATADVDGTQIVGSGSWYTYAEKPSRAQKQPTVNSVWFARMKDTYKVLGFTAANRQDAEHSMLSSGFAGFEAYESWFGFLYFTVDSPEFHQLKDRYCTGATQVALTNDGLSRIEIRIPDEKIAFRYGDLANPTINEILTLRAKNDNLRRTRDLLLPKLISGEVDAEELDPHLNTSEVS